MIEVQISIAGFKVLKIWGILVTSDVQISINQFFSQCDSTKLLPMYGYDVQVGLK